MRWVLSNPVRLRSVRLTTVLTVRILPVRLTLLPHRACGPPPLSRLSS